MSKYFYLAIFNIVLFAILVFIKKDKLHSLLSLLLGYLLLFALGFSYIAKVFVSRNIYKMFFPAILSFIAIIMIIAAVKSGFSKIPKKELSLRPISILFIFVVGYILGIISMRFNLPGLTGYLIGIISFLCGIIIYRTQPKKII